MWQYHNRSAVILAAEMLSLAKNTANRMPELASNLRFQQPQFQVNLNNDWMTLRNDEKLSSLCENIITWLRASVLPKPRGVGWLKGLPRQRIGQRPTVRTPFISGRRRHGEWGFLALTFGWSSFGSETLRAAGNLRRRRHRWNEAFVLKRPVERKNDFMSPLLQKHNLELSLVLEKRRVEPWTQLKTQDT